MLGFGLGLTFGLDLVRYRGWAWIAIFLFLCHLSAASAYKIL